MANICFCNTKIKLCSGRIEKNEREEVMKKGIICFVAMLFCTIIFVGCGNKEGSANKEKSLLKSAELADDTTDDEAELEEETKLEEKEKTTDADVEAQNLTTEEDNLKKTTIRVASLKGPTSIGLVKLRKESEEELTKNQYQFEMYTAADEIVPLLVKGEIDIAAIPANLAAVLFQKTEGKIKALNINTLGVLYLVENGNQITSFSDLKGKTVYMTGKGTTPEYAFRYLMKANGLKEEDVTIEFKSEAAEVANVLSTQENTIAVLPQPFVTVALSQNENLKIKLDFTEEWNRVSGENGSSLVTGVTVVRSEFLEENKEAVRTFLEEQVASVDYVTKDIEGAANLVEYYDIIKAPIAKKAIPYCNITCIMGEEMEAQLSGYLKALYEENKESVGGTLPDEAFYYKE